jgi:hypothetical protein
MQTRQVNSKFLALALLALIFCATSATAQTTAFSYQGHLTDGGNPANGNYDLQFALFDNLSAGSQIGSTQTSSSVSVGNGNFTVSIDFGINAFPGADRFLQIAVRPAGGGSFTTLSPRQQIASSPYAIRTLRAAQADGLSSTCVACVSDAQINSVAGSKLIGTIPVASVPSGSTNYIQNTSSQQASSNFNVGGNGTIGGNLTVSGTLNATLPAGSANYVQNSTAQQANTQFNISGDGTLGGSLHATQVTATTAAGQFGLNHIGAGIWLASYIGSRSGASGGWLGTQSNDPLHFFVNGAPRMTLTTAGNVGIGTTVPISKLHVVSGTSDPPSRLQSSGTTSFAAGWDFYQGATPKGYVGVPDGSASFGPGELLLYGASGTKTSLWANGIRGVTIDTTGNVGIGTVNPAAKLEVEGGNNYGIYAGSLNSIGVVGATNVAHTTTTPGVWGISSGDGGIGVLGQADIGGTWAVAGKTTSPSGIAVYGENTGGGLAVYANGNAGQTRTAAGFAKALLQMNSDGTVARCYNSFLSGNAATTAPCGFTTSNSSAGIYSVDFGFQISDRFLLATGHFRSDSSGAGFTLVSLWVKTANVVEVRTYFAGESAPGKLFNSPFYLVVY